MAAKLTKPLETATRKQIDLMLLNFGWTTDENDPDCNVFTERAKTVEQDKKFMGDDPDYVLYQSKTDNPIAIIEAKRKGQDIDDAISDAERKYANPLGVKIIFAYDGAFFKSWHTEAKTELLVDGIAVTQLVTERKVLRFLKEGYNISEVAPVYKYSRAELIKVFKEADKLLRKEGLREGVERFTEFANLLFLKLISEMEKDRQAKGEPRLLDDVYCWDSFANLDGPRMLAYINNTVLPQLVKEYNHSGDVFQDKLLIKNHKTLTQIVSKLSATNFMDTDSDVKGDAFEYFLKDSITVGHDLGEYFTPRHIVNLMVELVEPKFGEQVYDPTCGTAGFLISAFNYIKNRCAKTPDNLKVLKEKTVYGRELTNTAKIAKMNMILTGDGHTNIERTDSLEHPVKDRYNLVLANPPYGQPTDFGGLYMIPSNNGDAVFIQHIFKSLQEGGRAAVVVPESLLFRRQKTWRKVREYLLKNAEVIAVISLPRGVFRPYVKQNKTSILIFRKDTGGTKSVWFYNLEADGFDLKSDLRRPTPENNDIPDLLKKWNEKVISNKSWKADIGEIKANDSVLSAKDYEPKEKKYDSRYPLVKFSTFMREAKQTITIDNATLYRRLTVKLYGGGVVFRDTVKGADLKVKEQKLVKTNQFIVAEIDAKVGGFGLIPSDLEGAIVSSHYFLYNLDASQVNPRYFDYVIRKGPYQEMISPYVNGTTNYADVRPDDVLELRFPLPPRPEQDRFIRELDEQTKIKEEAAKQVNDLIERTIKESFYFRGDSQAPVPPKPDSEQKEGLNGFVHHPDG